MQRRQVLQGPGHADAAQPAGGFPLCGAAVEALGAQELGNRGGHRFGRGDERGVRDQPAGGDVTFLGQGIAFQPQLPDCGQLASVPDLVQPGRLAPRINARRGLSGFEDGGEFLLGVFQLLVRHEQLNQFLAQLGQDFDVERGVAQPRFRQGAGGPVGGGVFLRQAEAQELFDHGGEAHPGQPGKAGGELGVEEFVRPHAEFGQAGQVLAGGVQDPFDAAQSVIDDAEVPERFGIDQPGSGAFAPDLDQEGALAVAEPRGALRVHARRAVAGGEGRGAAFESGLGFNDQRHAVAGNVEVDHFRDQAVEAFHGDVGCGVSSLGRGATGAGRADFRILRGHGLYSLPTTWRIGP
ncbi:hypothetical protein SRABI128_06140 [Microbacterium sp. Bi128]|nr:hypothetical protein SRABI128_06140 [Microbacterium sp. Bi128]